MPESPQTPVFTLLDIGRSLQRMISKHYNKRYWIKTEIAKLNAYTKSGHCYPDLVEKQNGQVLAQMRATIWATTFTNLSKQFQDITKKPLSEGMTVLVLAKVNYHPNYGFSLNIIDIDASFTLGEMAKEKQESLKRLKAEGIFNLNRSLTFPKVPQRIAIISVDTSKGYQDFLNIMAKSQFKFDLKLFPALLQGDKAISSISTALERIELQQDEFDVVTIIRGGGGDVGLSCYDSFVLASKVARFPLPVVSGIGHSTNETLVEMVTYSNKITPTDVAYFFIDALTSSLNEIQNLHSRFNNLVQFKLKHEQLELKGLHQEFQSQVKRLLQQHQFILKEHRQRIKSALPSYFGSRGAGLNQSLYRLKQATRQQISKEHQFVNELSKTLQKDTKLNIEKQHMSLKHLSSTVKLLSPDQLLKRGYTLNLVNDKIITTATQLKTGQLLKTIFADGYAESEVIKTQTNGKN